MVDYEAPRYCSAHEQNTQKGASPVTRAWRAVVTPEPEDHSPDAFLGEGGDVLPCAETEDTLISDRCATAPAVVESREHSGGDAASAVRIPSSPNLRSKTPICRILRMINTAPAESSRRTFMSMGSSKFLNSLQSSKGRAAIVNTRVPGIQRISFHDHAWADNGDVGKAHTGIEACTSGHPDVGAGDLRSNPTGGAPLPRKQGKPGENRDDAEEGLPRQSRVAGHLEDDCMTHRDERKTSGKSEDSMSGMSRPHSSSARHPNSRFPLATLLGSSPMQVLPPCCSENACNCGPSSSHMQRSKARSPSLSVLQLLGCRSPAVRSRVDHKEIHDRNHLAMTVGNSLQSDGSNTTDSPIRKLEHDSAGVLNSNTPPLNADPSDDETWRWTSAVPTCAPPTASHLSRNQPILLLQVQP